MRRLDWDSEFFGYEVGEARDPAESWTELRQKAAEGGFKLVYVKTLPSHDFFKTPPDFFDHKVNFAKQLTTPHIADERIISLRDSVLTPQLLELAYLSGNHSRFKLDQRFKQQEFEKLYQAWIRKSLNREIASEVFGIRHKDKLQGFVSIKVSGKASSIGLIAVDANAQGAGLGKSLLQTAETYALMQGASELIIPTQRNNKQACDFYQKNGYAVASEELTFHLWT